MPVPVTIVPNNFGGGVMAKFIVSAATTNPTQLDVGSGKIQGWAITNTSAALSYVCFHDIAKAPVAGQNVWFKFGIPTGAAANVEWCLGIPYTSGLALTTVLNPAISDATAVAVNDLVITIFFTP